MIISRPGIAPRNVELLPSTTMEPIKPSANPTPDDIWKLPVNKRPFLSIPDAMAAAAARHAMAAASKPSPPLDPEQEPLLK